MCISLKPLKTSSHLGQAGSVEQLKLQQWGTAFLVLFVVLVTSLGRGLTITFFIVMQVGDFFEGTCWMQMKYHVSVHIDFGLLFQ